MKDRLPLPTLAWEALEIVDAKCRSDFLAALGQVSDKGETGEKRILELPSISLTDSTSELGLLLRSLLQHATCNAATEIVCPGGFTYADLAILALEKEINACDFARALDSWIKQGLENGLDKSDWRFSKRLSANFSNLARILRDGGRASIPDEYLNDKTLSIDARSGMDHAAIQVYRSIGRPWEPVRVQLDPTVDLQCSHIQSAIACGSDDIAEVFDAWKNGDRDHLGLLFRIARDASSVRDLLTPELSPELEQSFDRAHRRLSYAIEMVKRTVLCLVELRRDNPDSKSFKRLSTEFAPAANRVLHWQSLVDELDAGAETFGFNIG